VTGVLVAGGIIDEIAAVASRGTVRRKNGEKTRQRLGCRWLPASANLP